MADKKFNPQFSQASVDGNDYGLVAFYYPGHNTDWDNYYQAFFLGNFYECTVKLEVNGITGTFNTSEAAFQATKWWNNDQIRKEFEDATDGDEAFHISKKNKDTADYSYAGLNRDGAMLKVLSSKFEDPDLKQGLLDTGSSYLLEHNSRTDRDDYWSDNNDGTGSNKLGLTLMEVREKLGGNTLPCDTCKVGDFTKQVQSSNKVVMSEMESSNSNITESESDGLKIVPSVYSEGGKEGDFGWMIEQPEYADAFFIFNDNESQFLAHQNDPGDPAGCSVGGGNAVVRPYQCKTPPKAGGIPTGPSFSGLTDEVEGMIDKAIQSIRKIVRENNYRQVVYSSNGRGGLGTNIFGVPDDVKTYIVNQINSLG